MKRIASTIISLALAATFVFSMTAFASEEKATVKTVQEGVLNMATNAEFPPYEYKEGDDFAGIDIEIAQAIADELGLKLVVNDVEFGSIIGGVQSGKYDIGLAGITVTEERLKSINFTDSYATGIQSIIVPEDSAITSVDDLSGDDVIIGVQQDTTGDIYCSDDYGDDHVIQYKTGADAVQALKSGKVSCVVIDNEPAKSFVASTTGLKILDTEYVVEEYAACISKDNEELLEAVNKVIAELKESGKFQEIVDKYITSETTEETAETTEAAK